MAIVPKLELRQSQSLVMTPQLQQAIKLLQLSNLELSAFVEAELERNPLLERVDGEDDTPTPAAEQPDPALFSEREEGSAAQSNGAGPEAAAPEGEDGEWLDLESGSTRARGEDLDIEPQDAFPDSENFVADGLKDSSWGLPDAAKAAGVTTSHPILKPMSPNRGPSETISPSSSCSGSPIRCSGSSARISSI